MSISFHVEPYREALPEMQAFFPAHWREIAMHKDAIPLDVDYEKYEALDRLGKLHVVTVRMDGQMIGYHVSILETHLHYRTLLCAHTDIYFLAPEHRKGLTGVKLFQFVERSLKEKRVQVMTTGTKAHADISPIFERLGWTKRETVFTKLIESNIAGNRVSTARGVGVASQREEDVSRMTGDSECHLQRR